MSYEHKSNVHNRKWSIPIKTIGIISIILFLFYIFLPKFFPSLFTFIASPFIPKLEADYKTFVGSTELQNAIINELQKENLELRSLIHSSASSSDPYLAYILKKPPFTAYDSYLIDIGENKEIKVGNRVYGAGNLLIGEIVEINRYIAKVKLYSSYGEKYDVLIGKKNIQASAIGQGGGSFEVILPKDVEISEGDIVTVPDLDVSVFGIVKNIQVDSARSFSTILFSQPLNIYEQKWVLVNVKYNNEK